MASAVSTAEAGKNELAWPSFKTTKPDSFPGKKEMSPEQTLIEFISTSAAFHGVQKQNFRSLEWDILKVFPYNIMPANAAAWYMAKRKFYADQPPDQQLLPFLLKKYPNKFKVSKFQVQFLETYSKETAKRKLNYLVQYGIYAYFSHKVDEYGVYFFDPNYYEHTEPFQESIRLCLRGSRQKVLAASYFNQLKETFHYKVHSNNLATLTKDIETKVITNATCVIVSMVNNQFGFLKFGSGEKALFSAKALFRDGYQYSGDLLNLPAMNFDGYKVPAGTKAGEEVCTWIAVLVWCGRKPTPKCYSTMADFNLTPAGIVEKLNAPAAGKRLRQPSSSMMIGQVISIRKNGAVIAVREGRSEQVFVPGWSKENTARSGVWLTTLSGETLGLWDLVAYYIDSEDNISGFSAVGKDVIVLKEHEEVETKKKRRNRASVSMSEGAYYEARRSESSYHSDLSSGESVTEGDTVSDGELEWLEKDLENMIEEENSQAMSLNLQKLKNTVAEVRAVTMEKKSSPRERRDSGLGSNPTTPRQDNGPLKVGKSPNDSKNFWKTKAALAIIDEDYRSSDDEDYESGDEISSIEIPKSRRLRRSTTSSSTSNTTNRKRERRNTAATSDAELTERNLLPYWVRAVSQPEEYDENTGKFLPVDKYYVEERDADYFPQLTDDDHEEEPEAEAVSEDKTEEEGKTEKPEEGTGENLGTPPKEEKENLEEELKLLLEEAEIDLSEELLEGKHRPSLTVKLDTPEKIVVTDPSGEEKTEVVEQPAKQFKFWYQANYLSFVEGLKTDLDSDVESNQDPEYVPPAVIFDDDCDYDEFDPEEKISEEELKCLEEEATMELYKAGNYVPIWVPVDSVKERVERAREDLREREAKAAALQAAAEEKAAAQKAAEEKAAAQKAAEEKAAAQKAAEAAVEEKEGEEKEVKEIEGNKQDSKSDETGEPLPQRKPSTRSNVGEVKDASL